MDYEFGRCPDCSGELMPVYFTEEEYVVEPSGIRYKTGRKRKAVSHLVCKVCLKNICVDDTFDGGWY